MKKIYILTLLFFVISAVSAQNSKGNSAIQVGEPTFILLDNVAIYPNPAIDIVKISLKNTENVNLTINFFNNIGKLRFSQVSDLEPGVNVISIDLKNKNINSGVYFVEIVSDNERITRKLIVK